MDSRVYYSVSMKCTLDFPNSVLILLNYMHMYLFITNVTEKSGSKHAAMLTVGLSLGGCLRGDFFCLL